MNFKCLIIFIFLPFFAEAQDFILGAHLSYINEMEDCGGVYKEDDQLANHSPTTTLCLLNLLNRLFKVRKSGSTRNKSFSLYLSE